jgi:NitT/TauT family transport system ATP-binding protein
MLKIKHISKSFGEKEVLCDVSFDCQDFGITAIMGASGIGKTTLLNIIAGLETADSGTVDFTFSKIGYKFQEPRLFEWLTALDNIKIVIEDKQKAHQFAKNALALVGLSESEDKYPLQLSGGMQQRVALARALAFQGDLLLLDEPFSAVDAETKKQLIDAVRQYAKDHAVIIVTHDYAEAKALDAVIVELH